MDGVRIMLALAVLACAGCAHQVTFDKPAPYVVASTKVDAGVTVVVDAATVARKVPIRAMMTGLAHSWEVEPGDMLKQVAEIELPQVFSRYEMTSAYVEPAAGRKNLVVELSLPDYSFSDFHATVAVNAKVYTQGRRLLFDKTYKAEGETQGAKMFWGGAFGMKSAIRQSSLDAFKKAFTELRSDLLAALAR